MLTHLFSVYLFLKVGLYSKCNEDGILLLCCNIFFDKSDARTKGVILKKCGTLRNENL